MHAVQLLQDICLHQRNGSARLQLESIDKNVYCRMVHAAPAQESCDCSLLCRTPSLPLLPRRSCDNSSHASFMRSLATRLRRTSLQLPEMHGSAFVPSIHRQTRQSSHYWQHLQHRRSPRRAQPGSLRHKPTHLSAWHSPTNSGCDSNTHAKRRAATIERACSVSTTPPGAAPQICESRRIRTQ
jgi:hypothetical protein